MNSLIGKHWHHLSTYEILDLLETIIQQGLDVFEVKHRQERLGLNVLTSKRGQSQLVRFLPHFNNPLVIIFRYSGKNLQQRLYKCSTCERISLYN